VHLNGGESRPKEKHQKINHHNHPQQKEEGSFLLFAVNFLFFSRNNNSGDNDDVWIGFGLDYEDKEDDDETTRIIPRRTRKGEWVATCKP
jgi:hypothetical protein